MFRPIFYLESRCILFSTQKNPQCHKLHSSGLQEINGIVKIEMSQLFRKKVKQSRIQKSLLCPFGFSAKVIQLLCNLRGSLNIVDYFCCMRVFVFLFCGLFLFFCFIFVLELLLLLLLLWYFCSVSDVENLLNATYKVITDLIDLFSRCGATYHFRNLKQSCVQF